MIFIGDIAISKDVKPKIIGLPESFNHNIVVGNLEGPIIPDNYVSTKEAKLFNDMCVIEFLQKLNVEVVSLGNNHITDVPEVFEKTKEVLDKYKIARCGAGDNLDESGQPAIINIENQQYAFLSFGWNVISCIYAEKKRGGCSPLSTKWVMKCIDNTRKNYPNAKIITLPHWNYELELYPQPMHRELARMMIDAGVEGVFGHHTHCVNGIEYYKDAPIVYSLGNWFIPDGVYFNNRLIFPKIAKLQLAIEWYGKELICHWFEYKPDQQAIEYIESVPAKDCKRIKELTPYCNMDNAKYIKWFKKNRRKKRGLPVYKYANSNLQNAINTKWVLSRQFAIKFLLKLRVKSAPK
jgi:hypothetical protein